MEVKIGVTNTTRELTLDTDLDADGVEAAVTEALAKGGVLSLTDHRGRRVMVPVEKIGYVDVSAATIGPVGFRS